MFCDLMRLGYRKQKCFVFLSGEIKFHWRNLKKRCFLESGTTAVFVLLLEVWVGKSSTYSYHVCEINWFFLNPVYRQLACDSESFKITFRIILKSVWLQLDAGHNIKCPFIYCSAPHLGATKLLKINTWLNEDEYWYHWLITL